MRLFILLQALVLINALGHGSFLDFANMRSSIGRQRPDTKLIIQKLKKKQSKTRQVTKVSNRSGRLNRFVSYHSSKKVENKFRPDP